MLTVITNILMQIRAGVCSQPPGSPQMRRGRPPVYTDTWPWCCPFRCPATHIQITQPPCPSLIVTNSLRCTPCSPASSSARCFEISLMCCCAFVLMIPCSMDTTRLPRSYKPPGIPHFISCLIYSLCFIFSLEPHIPPRPPFWVLIITFLICHLYFDIVRRTLESFSDL
jgi:hypothetical protein